MPDSPTKPMSGDGGLTLGPDTMERTMRTRVRDMIEAIVQEARDQRRTARVDEAILGGYLAGVHTRRSKGALAPLLRN